MFFDRYRLLAILFFLVCDLGNVDELVFPVNSAAKCELPAPPKLDLIKNRRNTLRCSW